MNSTRADHGKPQNFAKLLNYYKNIFKKVLQKFISIVNYIET